MITTFDIGYIPSQPNAYNAGSGEINDMGRTPQGNFTPPASSGLSYAKISVSMAIRIGSLFSFLWGQQ